MDDVGVGRTLRALRLRVHLSQTAASRRAGISQATWSRIERGHLQRVPLMTLQRAFGAVDARLDLNPSWRGGAVDRLRDEGHSALVAAVVTMLQSPGWETAVEVTYSEFGERGSIDVLAVHPTLRLALIVEVKTEITSQEQMIRRLDEKTRLAQKIVFDRHGWRPRAASRLLVLESTMTNRRRVTALAPILDGAFPLRSDAARVWLRLPSGSCSALLFVSSIHRRT
ncbi:MAG TPA: helix-turn-helix transcriptional regulator [Candidatus Saccharimonadales bacterium]|nr:helix-turn-helix transcriptional regulator [Candidatus Saccharimonadales bacterium]